VANFLSLEKNNHVSPRCIRSLMIRYWWHLKKYDNNDILLK
jgi:hypothetical protein